MPYIFALKNLPAGVNKGCMNKGTCYFSARTMNTATDFSEAITNKGR